MKWAQTTWTRRRGAGAAAPALALVLALGLGTGLSRSIHAAPVYLNEILFNPPGVDTNAEYIEIRGAPNALLPDGTWFVAVEGDRGGNPGTVQNTFNLSGGVLGQNGHLLLLQSLSRYRPHLYCQAVTNADLGAGWGHGSSSSVSHRGQGGQTELENASATFFLINSLTAPAIGDDIDPDDDGTADGAVFAGWTIYDSVGIMDGDVESDLVYGRINFRRSLGWSATVPSGLVLNVPFTPGYVARDGNTTGWSAIDWVAGDNLAGAYPKWKLGRNTQAGVNTYPSQRAGALLGHLGAPNFAAPILPFVLVRETGPGTRVAKGGRSDSYLINLLTVPQGAVTIRATAAPPLLISLDGRGYSQEIDFVLTSKKSRKILTRVTNDNAVGPSIQHPTVTHAIVATADPASYPVSQRIRSVRVTVTDSNVVLLGEAKVNPPGTNDGPFEYIELIGPSNKAITNLHVLAIRGNESRNPGYADFAVDLSGHRFGANGTLVLAGTGHPYSFGGDVTVVTRPELAQAAGILDNGGLSILLVGSRDPIAAGADLDAGDNGKLERLPTDAVIMDAAGWRRDDQHENDVIYGGVDLTQRGFTPDAISRVPSNRTPNSAGAWMAGNLVGPGGESVAFDPRRLSTNLPPGSVLTPGSVNATAPSISPLTPLSHVLGDAFNPSVSFIVSDAQTPAGSLLVSATSTNPLVLPDANLTLIRGAAGQWTLRLTAIGVGYSDVLIHVSNGTYTGVGTLHFAASAPGLPGTVWHTGISDASTALPVDAKWMWVADDENQVLRIYSRTQSGGPVAAIDLNPFLGLVDFYNDDPARPKEVDLEGSTRVGKRIFWLGSHSHSADTLERTNRARLMATDISGSGTNSRLTFVGRYDFLKLDLLAWDSIGLHGKGPGYYGFADSAAVGVDPKSPDGSGFNLEGLCMAPGSATEAYLAFRAPLVPPSRALALIVPVTNFTTLAASGGPPGSARFGAPIELDLGGRGLRSIEGSGTNYLIVAGPAGTGTNLPPPGDFRLYTWTGRRSDAPRERTADLAGLNIEGIVEVPAGIWTATTKFQLVTDAGTNVYYGDDIPAKRLSVPSFKKFRTDIIELGGFAPAPAFILAAGLVADGLRLEWRSSERTFYQVQMRSTLDGPWMDHGSPVVATNSTTTTIVPLSEAQCFFRVLTVPEE